LADETGQPRCKAHALTALSELLVGTGEPEAAKEHSFRALEILTELGDGTGASAAYAVLGMAELRLGDLAASEEHYRESVSTLDGLDEPLSLGRRKLEFGRMLAHKGERARAREMIESAQALFRDAGAEDMAQCAALALSEVDGA